MLWRLLRLLNPATFYGGRRGYLAAWGMAVLALAWVVIEIRFAWHLPVQAVVAWAYLVAVTTGVWIARGTTAADGETPGFGHLTRQYWGVAAHAGVMTIALLPFSVGGQLAYVVAIGGSGACFLGMWMGLRTRRAHAAG